MYKNPAISTSHLKEIKYQFAGDNKLMITIEMFVNVKEITIFIHIHNNCY